MDVSPRHAREDITAPAACAYHGRRGSRRSAPPLRTPALRRQRSVAARPGDGQARRASRNRGAPVSGRGLEPDLRARRRGRAGAFPRPPAVPTWWSRWAVTAPSTKSSTGSSRRAARRSARDWTRDAMRSQKAGRRSASCRPAAGPISPVRSPFRVIVAGALGCSSLADDGASTRAGLCARPSTEERFGRNGRSASSSTWAAAAPAPRSRGRFNRRSDPGRPRLRGRLRR